MYIPSLIPTQTDWESAIIFAADTWLHMATTTVSLSISHPLPTQEALYGFSSLSSCTKCNNSFAALLATNTSCTFNSAFREEPVYDDPVSTILTLSGRSPSASVLHVSNSNLSYLGMPSTAQNPNHDFQASTYGVRAACSPISQACNLTVNGNVTFNCDDGNYFAEGDQMFKQGGLAIQAFKYSNLSDYDDGQQLYGVPNPFYIAGATANELPPDSTLSTDAEVVVTDTIISAVFLCQITVLDLEYTSLRGNVNVVSERASNESVTNMFASGIAGTAFGQDAMKVNLNTAAVVAKDAQDFTNGFSRELSNAILSSGAGSVKVIPVESAQTRADILAARIPKAPFFLLVASNLTFVLLGFVLTVIAMTTPADARQAQYQLTTAGLVSNLSNRGGARNQVDAVEQLFVEYYEPASGVKIGIDRTSKGGFELMPIQFAR